MTPRWPLPAAGRLGVGLAAWMQLQAFYKELPPGAHTWLNGPQTLAVAGLGMAAVVVWVAGPWRLAPALTALCCLWLLGWDRQWHTGQGALHHTFYAGAAMAGWVAGAVLSRVQAGTFLPRKMDAYGHAGALGALAATYVNAGISKLANTGLGWAQGNTIRTLIAEHYHDRPLPLDSLVHRTHDLLLYSPWTAQTLATATLVLETGAAALLLPRPWRTLWAAGLLAFHLTIHWLVPGIFYSTAVVLLVTLALVPDGLLPHTDASSPPPPSGGRTEVGVRHGRFSPMLLKVKKLSAQPPP